MRALRDALLATRLVLIRGFRKIGKALLKSCKAHLEDVAMPCKMEDLLQRRGLPTSIDDIEDSGDETPEPDADFPPEFQQPGLYTSSYQDGFRLDMLDQLFGPAPTEIPLTGPPMTQTQDPGPSGQQVPVYYSDQPQFSQPYYAEEEGEEIEEEGEEEEEEEDETPLSTPCLARTRGRRNPNPPNKFTPSDPTRRGPTLDD